VITHNCFARHTHTYLDLDSGQDFDSKIIVKVNAVEVLRRELTSPRWEGDTIAMGTNVDCYQRARGPLPAHARDHRRAQRGAKPLLHPHQGTLLLRDLPLLVEASGRAKVSVAYSVGLLDESLWRLVESGAPSPMRRLAAIREVTDAGFRVPVLMAPILPGLTDDSASIEATVAAIAQAGAATITPLVLHLRPGRPGVVHGVGGAGAARPFVALPAVVSRWLVRAGRLPAADHRPRPPAQRAVGMPLGDETPARLQ
jgi:DNA repair photolyase